MLQRARIGISKGSLLSHSIIRKRFSSTNPSSQQPPINNQPKINPHSVFYRQFAKPFTKICVISIGTYYGLIYLWEYLEKEAQESEN
ncbi:hypothetical protein JTP64_001840 [Candida tropicalis]|nr:hypothetical protein JTP64_001840 [Candida tropicalis]